MQFSLEKIPLDEPTPVIEFLAHLPQIKTYLELGVRCGRTIKRVASLVDKAVGVDLSYNALSIDIEENMTLHETATDNFFASNNDKYDLIFIDASHHYEQVKMDLFNSIQILNEGGLIALHDVNPLSSDLIDPRYCSDSYKITKYIYEHYTDYQFIVLNHDQAGVGILQKKLSPNL